MKKVTILLSSYNGETYLDEQLESIVAQKGVMTDILVRDDGSSDHTCDILDQWQQKTSIIYSSEEALEALHSDVVAFAKAESLTAHANSIQVRFGEDEHGSRAAITKR